MKKVLIIIFLLTLNFLFSSDNTADNAKTNESDIFFLKRNSNNFFFHISDSTELNINNNGQLSYRHDRDKFYPQNVLFLQGNYIFPVNKVFGIGPSIIFQNIFKIFHEADSTDENSTVLQFNNFTLAGISFNFSPVNKKINMPVMFIAMDFGPAIQLDNDTDDGDSLNAKFGGFNTLALMLPVMPVHLFIFDLNVIAVMSVKVKNSWYPAVRLINIFTLKFAFFNFINKKSNSGIKINNDFQYILTGRPSFTDLTSSSINEKLNITFFFGMIKGFELHAGYGFQYRSFARDPLFHIAHKLLFSVSWAISGFYINLDYALIFWEYLVSSPIYCGYPMNQIKIEIGYKFDRMDKIKKRNL